MAKRVAVVLAGCGVFDGTEIHEASAVLVHLSRNGASVSSSYFNCTHVSAHGKELEEYRTCGNQIMTP